MENIKKEICAILVAFSALLLMTASPVRAQEPGPGDACTVTGAFMRSGGPETSGNTHFMICDGSIWYPFLSYRSSGLVGIGEDVPQAALDVGGGVKIANDAAACAPAKNGTIRYVSGGDPAWEYCDGGGPGWLPFEHAASGGCGFNDGSCPPANSSLAGCISGRTISWGAVSCATSGTVQTITFTAPLVDGLKASGNNSAAAQLAAQYWCAELTLGMDNYTWASLNEASYWRIGTSFDPTGWMLRPVTTQPMNTQIICFNRVSP